MNWRSYTTDPALSAFVPVEAGRARMLVRREYAAWAGLLGLNGVPAEHAERVHGGRQAHPVVELPGGERVVVRGYRRGGAMRHLNRERYLGGHRSLEELRVTERARAAGVRVPQVVAAAERRGRVGYTATLATRLVPGARELAGWLAGREPREVEAVLRETGRQVGRMHGAGVAHPDLNLRNVLVAEGGGPGADDAVYLLDFDKARLFPTPVPPARRARDLERLARSARKLRSPISPAAWAAFREGYGAAWPPRAALG